MTKILTRMCSIPDINGDYKESRCDLNVIYAVQFDIELYNYIDCCLRKLRLGILREEMKAKVTSAATSGGGDEAAAADGEAGGGEKVDDNIDEEDDELKKVEGVF